MTDVNFSAQGPPDVVLPAAPSEADAALGAARELAASQVAVAEVLAHHPTFLAAWAEAGQIAERSATNMAGKIEAYAYFRVGYHRGLDALRKHGWKGSGFVRSTEPTNLGFLNCLAGLGRMAAAIGEADEAHRCDEFLRQLDPDGR